MYKDSKSKNKFQHFTSENSLSGSANNSEKPSKNSTSAIEHQASRLVIIADGRMDWAARFTIASARIKAKYRGEIVMIGECVHPGFDSKMDIEYHDWNTASKGLLPDSPWGPFRKPQIKPFLIRKFFKDATVFLDADIFCAAPIDYLIQNCRNWACAITKHNPNILPLEYMNLWGVSHPPTQQFNSGVLVFKERDILTEWCKIFEEALIDKNKYDYLINKQPWSYDQIGLIIAAARKGLHPEVLNPRYNFEVAAKGWEGSENAAIVHFTNWKVFNYAELLCLSEKASPNMGMIEVGRIVQEIEDNEKIQPKTIQVNDSLRAIKATQLIKKKFSRQLIVGVNGDVSEVILATPMIQALSSMGWKIDFHHGVLKERALEVLNGLNIKIVTDRMILERDPYAAVLQTVWPVRGLERLSGQSIYAAKCQYALKHNLFLHEVEANMALSYAMGYKGEIPPLYCQQKSCDLTEQLSSLKNPLVGIYYSEEKSNYLCLNRLYDLEIVSSMLSKKGWRVILLGWPSMKTDFSIFPEGSVNLLGKLNISQIADAISRLDILISENSEGTQIAAAMDCPQVSIFPHSSSISKRPWSQKAQIIITDFGCDSCLINIDGNNSKCQIDQDKIKVHQKTIVNHVGRMLDSNHS